LTPPVTALANDYEFNYTFARQLEAFGRRGDVFVGFSADGAANVTRAAQMASEKGLRSIGFTAMDGGELEQVVDVRLWADEGRLGYREVVHKFLALTLAQAARTLMSPPAEPW
jgi:D-sedoheptulose 7-phosphate isomerase